MPCSLPTDSEVSDYSDDEPDNTYIPRATRTNSYDDSDEDFYPESNEFFSRLVTRPIDPTSVMPRRPVVGERRSDILAARIISMVRDMNPAVPPMPTRLGRDFLNPDEMLAILDRSREQGAAQGTSGTQTGNTEPTNRCGIHRNPPAAPAPPANATARERVQNADNYLENMERIISSGTNPLTIETHYVAPELRPLPFSVTSRPAQLPSFPTFYVNWESFRRARPVAPAAPQNPGEDNQTPSTSAQPAPEEPSVSPYAGLIGDLRRPSGEQQSSAAASTEEAQAVPQVQQTAQPARQPLQEIPPPNNDQQRSSRFRYIMNRQYTQPGNNGLIIDTLPNGERVRRNGSE